ncbi:arylsulfatase A-like enzyme [Mariniflexile fucanivorans]|uniref:Arylsulfatase A-like enzyme n=1 Tax=Mariniflexile fucanivorans TaxID=264023 RepID=A0A4R1RIT2_9FLAO|nr:sulfatase [Mariniflexile fucanivorans]TCL65562.1 arylsulfatase A-like enzyme [Mariniflexile fucanivorans]
MVKNKWITLVFLILVVIFNSCKSKSEVNKTRRPNIVFIMTDDHAYQAISAYGHGLNNTPNIDRIAKEGAIFNRGYVTNSICAPSRAVMLTGKHSFVNGKVDNVSAFNWDQDNFAKSLQKSGYQTALVGKIHMDGLPQGFDYSNVLPGQGEYYSPEFIENGVKKIIPGYITTITTDIALNWLKNKREKDKPFLLLYHQKAPHRTWMPEEKYFTLFDDKTFDPPANFFDDYEGRPAAATQEMSIFNDMDLVYDLKMLDKEGDIKTKYRGMFQRKYDRMTDEQKAAWDAYYDPIIADFKAKNPQGKDLALWKYNRYMHDYLRTVQSVDDGVGQVLDYLKENGLEENTIVVYTSDQGFYLGEHGWFDKRFMYEESFRTPILVKYPKEIKAGTVIDELVQNLDFAPTFLDYAGVDIPTDIQGESLRKLVKGEASEWRDAIYYTFYEFPGEHKVKRHYGVRTDRYKLIHFYYDIDQWELFDLEKDPSEMKNVYNDPSYADVKNNMHEQLEKMRTKYGDSDELNQASLNRVLKGKISNH